MNNREERRMTRMSKKGNVTEVLMTEYALAAIMDRHEDFVAKSFKKAEDILKQDKTV